MIRPPKPQTLFHLNINLNKPFPEDVLICGDPDRVNLMLAKFDTREIIGETRGFRIAVGALNNPEYPEFPLSIAAVNTGIGGESLAIVVEELIHAGARRIIRVGTAGLLQEKMRLHSLIISLAAYRCEGTSLQYTGRLGSGYPAVANFEIVQALAKTAKKMQHEHAIGPTAHIAGFYPNNFPEYALDNLNKLIKQALIDIGTLAVSMEEAVLFILGQLRKIQVASILAVTDKAYEHQDKPVPGPGIDNAIKVAIQTLLDLHTIRLNKKEQ